jgi:hypothetical protein
MGTAEVSMTKVILGTAVGLLLALLAGWFWGASGQRETTAALQAAELQGDLLGARAALLDARVAVYSVNFGEASGHLENARGLLHRAEERLRNAGRDDQVQQAQNALKAIDEAQRMAGKLDQSANSRAGDAAKILADMLNSGTRR